MDSSLAFGQTFFFSHLLFVGIKVNGQLLGLWPNKHLLLDGINVNGQLLGLRPNIFSVTSPIRWDECQWTAPWPSAHRLFKHILLDRININGQLLGLRPNILI